MHFLVSFLHSKIINTGTRMGELGISKGLYSIARHLSSEGRVGEGKVKEGLGVFEGREGKKKEGLVQKILLRRKNEGKC